MLSSTVDPNLLVTGLSLTTNFANTLSTDQYD